MNGMNDEEAQDLRAKYPQLVEEARQIIRDALCDVGVEGRHHKDCNAAKFVQHNRMCPPNHPIWKHAPACDCWVGQAAEFLKNH